MKPETHKQKRNATVLPPWNDKQGISGAWGLSRNVKETYLLTYVANKDWNPRVVWLESSLSAQRNFAPLANQYTPSEDSDLNLR